MADFVLRHHKPLLLCACVHLRTCGTMALRGLRLYGDHAAAVGVAIARR